MMPPVVSLPPDDPRYPAGLKTVFAAASPQMSAPGNLDLLDRRKLAVLSSRKCPGRLILKAHDLAQRLRDTDIVLVSGFQSPVEDEFRIVHLRGNGSLIVCAARGMWSRLPREYRVAFNEERLLILSAYNERTKRPTERTGRERNRLVAALADEVLIAHAEPDSSVTALAREVAGWGKSLYTLADEANAHLVVIGARPIGPDDVAVLLERLG